MLPTRFDNSSCAPTDTEGGNLTSMFEEDVTLLHSLEEALPHVPTVDHPKQQQHQHQPLSSSTTTIIQVDQGSLIFQKPPTAGERQFMSLVKLLAFHMAGLSAWDDKVAAVLPMVDFFRVALNCTFVEASCDNHQRPITDKVRIAEATIQWLMLQTELTRPRMEEIEKLVLRSTSSGHSSLWSFTDNNRNLSSVDDFAVPYQHQRPIAPPPTRPLYQQSISLPFLMTTTESNNSKQHPLYQSSRDSFKRRRVDNGDNDDHEMHPQQQEIESTMSANTNDMIVDEPPGQQYPEIKVLQHELKRIQTQVGHIPENDVHRGKGQGIKNINSRFYTPLITSRALEYGAVNGTTKIQVDHAKQAIALQIYIELARWGGRIRDAHNQAPLDNQQALKKIMVSLKDKAREMKRKGGDGEAGMRSVTGEVVCLERRTRENVEWLKMIRARNSDNNNNNDDDDDSA